VHFDEGPSHQPPPCLPVLAPYAPICHWKLLKAGRGRVRGIENPERRKLQVIFGAEPSYATSIRWKLTYIKIYDIILKKDFFKKHLTILKKYDII
jgi:hypothetical protein